MMPFPQKLLGNTSTDVEKTLCAQSSVTFPEKHLHGRGEDRGRFTRFRRPIETPPRTWRRHVVFGEPVDRVGNTSTDVEKTARGSSETAPTEKHLHGRGEDMKMAIGLSCLMETPPRTWRRPAYISVCVRHGGNTSTDVEKTGWGSMPLCLHPETPPRTWRRLNGSMVGDSSQRNTSTDVEKTRRKTFFDNLTRKHLHGRGED